MFPPKPQKLSASAARMFSHVWSSAINMFLKSKMSEFNPRLGTNNSEIQNSLERGGVGMGGEGGKAF